MNPLRANLIAFADPFLRAATSDGTYRTHTLQLCFDWQNSSPWPPTAGEVGQNDWLGDLPGLGFALFLWKSSTPPTTANLTDPAFFAPPINTQLPATILPFLDVNLPAAWSPAMREIRSLLWSKLSADVFDVRQHTRRQGVPLLQAKPAPNWFIDYYSRLQTTPPATAQRVLCDRYLDYVQELLRRLDVLNARKASITSASTVDDGSPEERALEAFQKLCIDEPTIGHLFRVLFTVELKLPIADYPISNADYWLLARPMVDGALAPLDKFQAVPTRARVADSGLISILTTDPVASEPEKTYYCDEMAVRQFYDGRIEQQNDVARMNAITVFENRALHQIMALDVLNTHARSRFDTERKALLQTNPPPIDRLASLDAKQQALIDAINSLEAADLGHDAIGLSWDVTRLAAVASAPRDSANYHRGYKGYRIFVRKARTPEQLKDSTWKSLCWLDRELTEQIEKRVLKCVDGSLISRVAAQRKGQLP